VGKLDKRRVALTKRLIIVGFGGFGRETLAWARDIEPTQGEWRIAGVLDPSAEVVADRGYDVPYLGSPLDYQPEGQDVFAIAVGDSRTREKFAQALISKGGRLVSLVHPTAVIGPNVRIGEGAIICPRVVLTCDITVGQLFLCNVAATLGHDVKVGKCCSIYAHADVTGHAVLGDHVTLGSHAVVLPHVKVGNGAMVGAGSVAVANVPPAITVFGIPGRKVHG
jgi:sugar O-acyltransferase (sialic acid O-acetyltransferase NeuD family)